MEKAPLLFAMDPVLTKRVFTPEALLRLGATCCVLDQMPMQSWESKKAQELLSRAEILVTGWGAPPLNTEMLDQAGRLKIIAHSAGSVRRLLNDPNFFDRGVTVTTAAAANAIPVAEFTLAAILLANKKVFHFREIYRQERSRNTTAKLAGRPIGNFGKTVGIVGASRIGRMVIEMLRGFNLDVLIYDPHLSPDDPVLSEGQLVELSDLLSRSDAVSLHAPLLDTTRNMIGASELALMADGTTLINTARGALVDQEALIKELSSRRLNAVIDVTFPEVPISSSPLYDLPNVFLTPHVAGALGEEQSRLGDFVVDEVARHCAGAPLRHTLTAEAFDRTA